MKIKFNSDDELPLNKTIHIPSMIIVVTAIFLENKYYPQVFFDQCIYKIWKWRVKMNLKKRIFKIVHVIILMIYRELRILTLVIFYPTKNHAKNL